ncbi:hypothetical protein IAU60_003251 [Kwoniella sp. DSM 27419]
MSPSRIPRPGVGGSPVASSSPAGGIARSPLGATVHTPVPTATVKSNNPFAQMHNRAQAQAQMHGSPTASGGNGGNSGGKGGMPQPQKRRPKPPSPDIEDVRTTTAGIQRRPVPTESPSSLPRPRLGGGTTGLGLGQMSGHGGAATQRSILRQPSTPSLGPTRDRSSPAQPAGRPRAVSSASAQRQAVVHNTPQHQHIPGQGQIVNGHTTGMRSLPSQKLFESSFLEHREPPVPPHIRVRLRLIHQLGVVLGIDAVGISGKIDIPGLLARVDQAHERERGRAALCNGAGGVQSPGGSGDGLTGGASAGFVSRGDKAGGSGVFGMFKRLGGRKTADGILATPSIPDGPAFGVALSEAPPGSWCTSLIGGQKHELPLVVFTVVEEIYRRGMCQPGIFRLAGDGVRISSLTKVFNLPPLYGDSLPIAGEPIHNLTGLIKRYVRDLPEPILDDSLFPAFLAFCVDDDEDKEGEGEGGEASQDGNAPAKDDEVQAVTPSDKVGDTDRQSDAFQVANSAATQTTKSKLPLAARITAAQILLKLLPPLHFSLFIYLLAFLGQLPLFPDNRLNIESISIIFGPAMCAARNRGVAGLGPTTSGGPGGGAVGGSSFLSGSGGRKTNRGGTEGEADAVSNLVEKSQAVLAWLLRNWAGISEKVLDDEDPLVAGSPVLAGGGASVVDREDQQRCRGKKEKPIIDPRLLSPIDLRGTHEGIKSRKLDPSNVYTTNDTAQAIPSSIEHKPPSPPTDVQSPSPSDVSPAPTIVQTPLASPQQSPLTYPRAMTTAAPLIQPTSTVPKLSKSTSHANLRSSPSSTSLLGLAGLKSSPSSGGLFARALSSMSISSQSEDKSSHGGHERSASTGGAKGPKRSASFTSISSLVKKVGKDQKGGVPASRSMSDDKEGANASVNPQITSVLGSLHDLLVNKDKQIERDARELALLRHTLLEMDEKLQRATSASPLPGPVGLNGCTCPVHPNFNGLGVVGSTVVIAGAAPSVTSTSTAGADQQTPEITITSTPSSSTLPTSPSLNSTQSHTLLRTEITELQQQLATALAALETSRLGGRKNAERILELEARVARCVSDKRLEVSKLEVALALEQARCVGLVEERDLARERLEKVKTTLFSVA